MRLVGVGMKLRGDYGDVGVANEAARMLRCRWGGFSASATPFVRGLVLCGHAPQKGTVL